MKNRDIPQDGDMFVGARLAARRVKAGIPMEKVAKDLRMSLDRLRAIEADDLSGFAHPTYARLFLIDYANYLRVPVEEIRDYLPGAQVFGNADNKYLEVLIANNGFLKGDQFKSVRRLIIGLAMGLGAILLVVFGIYSWRFWEKFERVKPVAVPVATPAPKATPQRPVPQKPLPVTVPQAVVPEAAPVRPVTLPIVTPAATPVSTPIPAPSVSPTPFTLPPFKPSPIPVRAP